MSVTSEEINYLIFRYLQESGITSMSTVRMENQPEEMTHVLTYASELGPILSTVGFVHTGFAFQNETHIHKSELKNANVQQGALVNILQKGLQYTDLELHVNEVPCVLVISCILLFPFLLKGSGIELSD